MANLITQAAFARRRGISRVAVHLRTTTNGGPIPVHGPKKLIDVDEADALWEATKSRQGVERALGAAAAKQAAPERASVVSGTMLAQARAARSSWTSRPSASSSSNAGAR